MAKTPQRSSNPRKDFMMTERERAAIEYAAASGRTKDVKQLLFEAFMAGSVYGATASRDVLAEVYGKAHL
jgi:hypothetical protein